MQALRVTGSVPTPARPSLFGSFPAGRDGYPGVDLGSALPAPEQGGRSLPPSEVDRKKWPKAYIPASAWVAKVQYLQ